MTVHEAVVIDETARLIADSARFLDTPEQIERARALRWNDVGFDHDFWRTAADQGWLGLRVAESRGGVGLGVRELCALCEMLGRGLAPEPLAEAITIAPLLDDTTLADVIAGRSIVLPAWQEASSDRLVVVDGCLSGTKRFVRMAAGANRYLVSGADGLFLVDASDPNLNLDISDLHDGGHLGTLHFDRVLARPLPGTLDCVIEELTVATAAYLLGAMSRAFDVTLDYLRTRRQFDRPIGSFQALQHRAADLYIQIELARASIGHAAELLDDAAGQAVRARAVARAKARASDAALLVTKQGIQLHGGIGFTDEANIGLFLRKALATANMYGSSHDHRVRYGASLDWEFQEETH